MKKSALTVMVGVLLIIYSIINFGAGLGQLGKAKAVCTFTNAFSSDIIKVVKDRIPEDNQIYKEIGYNNSFLYFLGIFILFTALLEIVAGIGLFSGADWTCKILIAAALCGVMVEIQDTIEDGFGIGKGIFLFINLLAALAAFKNRRITA
ncbi:MAG: hypothetical protein JRJ49_10855 [Deltaproteobacteria bacterium]|nr:hypothetical protein [Deltaproteobacteria bacterium]